MILCDKFKNITLDIKFVIELDKKVYNHHYFRKQDKALSNNDYAKKIVDDNKIYYWNKPLYDFLIRKPIYVNYILHLKQRKFTKASSSLKIKLENITL